jgi:hypothetical protein
VMRVDHRARVTYAAATPAVRAHASTSNLVQSSVYSPFAKKVSRCTTTLAANGVCGLLSRRFHEAVLREIVSPSPAGFLIAFYSGTRVSFFFSTPKDKGDRDKGVI